MRNLSAMFLILLTACTDQTVDSETTNYEQDTISGSAEPRSTCSPPHYIQPMYCDITAQQGYWTMVCGFGATQDQANAACTQACGGKQATTAAPLDSLLLTTTVDRAIQDCAAAQGVPLPLYYSPSMEFTQELLNLLECTAVLTSNQAVGCMLGAWR